MRDDVRLAMAGDRQAFGRLVTATHPVVAAITLGITRDPDASTDATQDVFLAAWLGLRRLRNPDSFLPWLRQLARHVAYSTRRASGRRARRQMAGAAAEALLAHMADPADGPDAGVLAAERRALLDAALDALPDETRDCVVLYYREGESAERVAALLGLTGATVRKRLERARRRLRADLMARLGDALRDTASGVGETATLLGMLGSVPRDAHAAVVSGAGTWLAGAAMLPLPALGGAAVGLGGSAARIAAQARRLAGSPRITRWFVGIASATVLLLGVVLPLTLPRLLWAWYALHQGAQAFVTFIWLPRRGVRPTRGDLARWLALTIGGAVAVAWAVDKMA